MSGMNKRLPVWLTLVVTSGLVILVFGGKPATARQSTMTFHRDVAADLLEVYPHMHLRGKAMNLAACLPVWAAGRITQGAPFTISTGNCFTNSNNPKNCRQERDLLPTVCSNNLPVLAYKIDRLLDDGERFTRMQANAKRLARPHAARDVVNRLLELQRET
jgi:hypothetical protein